MPTGYTCDVQDGKITELADFAMRCARAFGALIMMRDEPTDAPIPDEFLPSDYHAKALQEAKEEREALLRMTHAEADAKAEDDYKAEVKRRQECDASKKEQRERYEAMLAKVQAWEPPSAEHVGFRDFMVSQLTDSINWDCKVYDEPPLKRLTAKEWLAEAIKRADSSVRYHEKELAEELERTAGRNRWIRQLRESLKPVAIIEGETT